MTALAVVLSGQAACSDMCSYSTLRSWPAPNDARIARLVEKNCGATTAYAYEIEIGRPSDGKERLSLALRYDGGRAEWPDNAEDVLDVRWVSRSELQITSKYHIRVFEYDRNVDGVSVRLRTLPGSKFM